MTKKYNTELLIVGAGPYGLAMAIVARAHSIDYLITGQPMAFWKTHMPSGMLLRTPCDWDAPDHLERYMRARGLTPEQIKPVPVELFISYVEDAIDRYDLTTTRTDVAQLAYENPGYTARLTNGDIINASNVVVATGYYPFRHIPDEFAEILPDRRYSHSSDTPDPSRLAEKRCLIIGGRQSAFECAGLLSRHAASVDIVYRHDTPEFKPSDWSWVYPYIERMRTNPGWFRRLPKTEQDAINKRFWKAGRSELEDWLLDKLQDQKITQWPNTRVVGCTQSSNGDLTLMLSNQRSLAIDHIILATGYRVDLQRLPYIAGTNIIKGLVCDNGFPILDERFQSTLPGLYFTGIHAVNDFGPFLFFVAGAFTSAEIIGEQIKQTSGTGFIKDRCTGPIDG